MKRLLSFYIPKAPLLFVYMLQQFEYNPRKFISWLLSYPNLFTVQKRGRLHLTARAKLMTLIAYTVWLIILCAGILPAVLQSKPQLVLIALLAPWISSLSVWVVTYLLQTVVVNPKQNREILKAHQKLQTFPAQRIAIIGSYGKTTMKELLLTVLSGGKKVKATPGNKNIRISHARWVNSQVEGDEDVLIFEYGEAQPGDIAQLATFSKPNIAVVTGLAPAHLDEYPSLEAVADDFAAIQHTVAADDLFINGTSELLRQKLRGNYYDEHGLGAWKVSDVAIDFTGTSFTLTNNTRKLQLKTQLLGSHQIGPLTAVVAIAGRLGMSDEQIVTGIAGTQPFEHRMQARHLHGAWIIDDTYNGNIEGMRAGLELLKALPGKKKIYVTPGLVDQGVENERVHQELGTLIAAANPDKVIVMQNSNTSYIQSGLESGKYAGEVVIETHPLEYYTNLEHFLAAGDVVMLQNDLPDSYK